MATADELYPRRPVVAWSGARLIGYVAILAGLAAAVVGWAPGVVMSVAGFVLMIVSDLAIGVFGYRRAMRAAWPKVAPAEDDDWD